MIRYIKRLIRIIFKMPYKVTLCGSNKFRESFHNWNHILSLKGFLVYSMGVNMDYEREKISPSQKCRLDIVHLDKIANSDCIFVIDNDDYIGESTCREILYARSLGKPAYFASLSSDLEIFSHREVSREFELIRLFDERNSDKTS